jgi:hypothetical protein
MSRPPNTEILKTMNKNKTIWLAALAIAVTVSTTLAQVPGIIQYQGRVTSNGTNFTGTGQFKFAIIDTVITGTAVWNNAGVMDPFGEPFTSVPVPVNDGLFIVGLGDTTLSNMLTIPASIFTYQSLKLRIWFSDGVGAFAALSPDQPITSVGFAMMAAGVAPNSIGQAQLQDGAVTGGKIASDAVAGVNLLNQTITGAKVVANSISSAEIADSIQLQQLTLGGALWDGQLVLNALGLGEPRGLFSGDVSGSHFQMQFGNTTTGVVLSARSPGGRLSLSDSSARETARLGTTGAGGELRLYQTAGTTGVFLDAQATGGGGELRLYEATGTESTVEILAAETSGTGAELRLRNASGIATVVVDAENDAQGGPRMELFTGTGASTMVFVPGGSDVTLGGGGLMRLGETAGNNLGIDGDEIIARTNGAAAPLRLNYGYTAPVVMSRLAIGTLTPATGYELSVNGQVICEELVVQNSAEWPDYVFAEDYDLMPLEEVEANIKKNKHLPGIPSAKKIGEDGIPLGQIQKQMMEKIEELTLHLIQQNKRLAAQEEELARLRSHLNVAK